METENDLEVNSDFQVLASSMRVPGAIARFADEFDPKDVGYIHNNMGVFQIYEQMIEYHHATKQSKVDPAGFEAWLNTESPLYQVLGGKEGYRSLVGKLGEVTLPELDGLVSLVKFRGRKQRSMDKIAQLQKEYETADSSKISDLYVLADEIKNSFTDIDHDPLRNVRTADDILRGAEGLWDMDSFLRTPYKSLNRALGYGDDGGFFRGGVHSIVALSGMGKSTLTKNLCNNWLDDGLSVLFVNFEEPQAHWERILMTQMTGINVYEKFHEFNSAQMADVTEKFKRRIKDWGNRLMVCHNPDTLYFEDLEQWFRELMGAKIKPDIVVIDTIQSLFTKTGGGARWGDYEKIMVRSEKLAKEMDAAFIFTAQQNLSSLKENREVLSQADMGGSATITQKSTVAMFITPLRGSSDENDTASDRLMTVQIVKSRITGTAFSQTPPMLVYEDDVKSYREYDPYEEDERYGVPTVDVDPYEDI